MTLWVLVGTHFFAYVCDLIVLMLLMQESNDRSNIQFEHKHSIKLQEVVPQANATFESSISGRGVRNDRPARFGRTFQPGSEPRLSRESDHPPSFGAGILDQVLEFDHF